MLGASPKERADNASSVDNNLREQPGVSKRVSPRSWTASCRLTILSAGMTVCSRWATVKSVTIPPQFRPERRLNDGVRFIVCACSNAAAVSVLSSHLREICQDDEHVLYVNLGNIPQGCPEDGGHQLFMHEPCRTHTASNPVEDAERCAAHACGHEQGIHCQVAATTSQLYVPWTAYNTCWNTSTSSAGNCAAHTRRYQV